MRLYSEIELEEQLKRFHLSPKQKGNVKGLISIITERYTDYIENMKCCGNCKHRGLDKHTTPPCNNCKMWHRKEINSDYWELQKC